MHTIGITGAGGLLGFHLRARLHALRRADVVAVPIHAADFDDEAALRERVARCDTIVHLAYQITGSSEEILSRNRAIDDRLTAAIDDARDARESRVANQEARPFHLVFASSTHIERDTPYGEAKRRSDAHFASFAEARGHTYTSVVFPHIYGEGGRPLHNSVVSTFCHQLARGEEPVLQIDSPLDLVHAQKAAFAIIAVLDAKRSGRARVSGRPMRVSELLTRLREIDRDYRSLLLPDLDDPAILDLFNTYRSYLYPSAYPTALALREDARGALFEAVKTKSGGQAFVSTTRPGITRGNHYHLHKLERFCVIRGRAAIKIRRLFSSDITTFEVSGEAPVLVDIPTLHTHTLVNTGESDLLTLFWASEIYNPEAPDTYPEMVEV